MPRSLATSRLDLLLVGQELVQRRVEQADGHRQAGHRLEDALEVACWNGRILERFLAGFLVVASARIISRMRSDPVALEEHVLGAAEADALGAELAGAFASRGVSALVRTPGVRNSSAQLHELGEVVRHVVAPAASGGTCALEDLAGAAVEGDPVALLEGVPVRPSPTWPA
jgi:hypothetical protein